MRGKPCGWATCCRIRAAQAAKAQRDTATHNLAGAAGFYGTPAQFRYIGSLLAERELTLAMQNWWHAVTIGEARCDKRGASQFIDALQQQPRLAPKADAQPLAEGYYADGDTVYAVVTSKAGNLYAKEWTVQGDEAKAKWVYAPGAVKRLQAQGATAMTLEQAKAWGHLHGRCIRCGRVLSDPSSVEAGIGPICQGYWL